MESTVAHHETGWSEAERAELTERIYRHLDAGSTDLVDSVMAIPVKQFCDPAIAASEKKRIFHSVPLVVAHTSELAEPYNFVTTEIAGTPFIVARQPDGSVRAFQNVCRHRGAPVTTELCGRARIFSCPYHGWSYDIDGALRSVTDERTFGAVERSNAGLLELPVEERHGFIWAIVDPDAKIDVGDWLGPMDEVLERYGLAGYVQYRAADVEVECNWKILVDAFVDGYHLKFVHRGTAAPYFFNNMYIYEQKGRHSRFTSARRSIARLRDEGVGRLEDFVTSGHFLMPNTTLLRQPTHFELLSFRPHATDPGRCTMTFRLVIPTAPATEAESRMWDKNWDILMKVVRDEDLPLNRQLQISAEDPFAPAHLLGRNEIANQQFHRQVDELIA